MTQTTKKATRKQLIVLLRKCLTGARLDHTEKCTWEELNHGGECGCSIDPWRHGTEPWPGLKHAIKDVLKREAKQSE